MLDTESVESVERSSNEVVISEAPKALVVMSEKRAIACAEKVRKSIGNVYENLRLLNEGSGWIALGYENWDEMCWDEFGYVPRSARRLRAMAILHHDVSGLLPTGEGQAVLDRMPDEALSEFKSLVKDAPEVVTKVVEDFGAAGAIPTVQETLEAIPYEMLTIQQQKKLAALQAKESDIVDYAARAEGLIESIRKSFEKLEDGLYSNLDYPNFSALVQDRFPELKAAWIDANGEPYRYIQVEGERDEEWYDSDQPAPYAQTEMPIQE